METPNLLFCNRSSKSLAPEDARLLARMAEKAPVLLGNGQAREALAQWQAQHDRLGRYPEVLQGMAVCLSALGDHANAARWAHESGQFRWSDDFIRKLHELAPANERWMVLYWLCCNLIREARWLEAEDLLSWLLKSAAKSPILRAMQAGVLMELKRDDQAMESYHQAGRDGMPGYTGLNCRLAQIVSARAIHEAGCGEFFSVHTPTDVQVGDLCYATPETFVLHAKDVLLVPCNFSLLLEDGKKLVHDGYDTNSRQSMVLLKNYRVHSSDDRILLDLPQDAMIIEEECILLGGGGNFSHCMNDWCSKLFVWSDFQGKRELPLLVSRDMPESVLEWLDCLGYSKNKVIWLEPGKSHLCRNLWAPSLSHSFQQASPLYLDHVRRAVRRITGAAKSPRRLYFSRAGAKVRQIVNEAELIRLLESRGFETILPEKVPLRQQLDMLANASVLIVPTGGASSACLFLPEGSLFLELQHPHLHTQQYKIQCALAQVRHEVLTGTSRTRPDAPLQCDHDLEIDLTRLAGILDQHHMR